MLVTEMKNLPEELSSGLDQAEERINALKDKSSEIIHSQAQKGKRKKKPKGLIGHHKKAPKHTKQTPTELEKQRAKQ